MSSMRRSTTASCRMREADGLRPASSCAAISPDSMRARSTVRPNRLAVLSRSTAHALVKSAGAPISVKAEKGLLSITPRDGDEGGPMPIFSGFAPGTLAENQQYSGLGRVDIHRVARTDPTSWIIAEKLVSVLS